jgi:curved DNA-binding protein
MREHEWQQDVERLIQMTARARRILGVGPGTPPEELRCAYRSVARGCHPDLNPQDPRARERFMDALAAYKLLSEGVRDERLLAEPTPAGECIDGGCHLDNDWGYHVWWRRRFFSDGVP